MYDVRACKFTRTEFLRWNLQSCFVLLSLNRFDTDLPVRYSMPNKGARDWFHIVTHYWTLQHYEIMNRIREKNTCIWIPRISFAKPHRIKMPMRQDFKVPVAGFVACHLPAPRTLAHSVCTIADNLIILDPFSPFLFLLKGRFHPRFYLWNLWWKFSGQWRWRPGRNLQGRLQFA